MVLHVRPKKMGVAIYIILTTAIKLQVCKTDLLGKYQIYILLPAHA